ncbi:MAG: hypothetical protein HC773_00865 [Scytonema sp. CRU_2_7]|nr:hypothetical protein [Scytonema sp. CRU_2_7]
MKHYQLSAHAGKRLVAYAIDVSITDSIRCGYLYLDKCPKNIVFTNDLGQNYPVTIPDEYIDKKGNQFNISLPIAIDSQPDRTKPKVKTGEQRLS